MRRRLAMLLLAMAGAAAADPVIQRVEVDPTRPVVRLRLSAPVTPGETKTLPADADLPPRLYFDLPGTRRAGAPKVTNHGKGALLRVRLGQFDVTTARIVLDLREPRSAKVTAAGRTITIELGAPPAVADATPTEPAPSSGPPPAPLPAVTARPAGPGATPAGPAPAAPAPPALAAPAGPTPPAPAVTTAPPVPPAPIIVQRTPPTTSKAGDRPWRIRAPLVVLDPGHGGHDPGATGVGGVKEKVIVLEVARLVAQKLAERLPVDVLLTRRDDVYLPIAQRAVYEELDATVFLSFHANSARDRTARGIDLFYGGGNVQAAATEADHRVPAALGRCLEDAFRGRGAQVHATATPARFGVLVRNVAPSVLIELGYLTNTLDAAAMQDPVHQALLAEAVVDGVTAFLRETSTL